MRSLVSRTSFFTTLGAALVLANVAQAGDASAGKTLFEKCADCHEPADFSRDPAELRTQLKAIASGKPMSNGKAHKSKLTLTEAQIEHVLAYIESTSAK